MSSRIRAHIRGNVVGYAALFVALSGTAVALPGANSVDGNDLRRNVVKSKNIRAAAVKSSDLGPNAVNSSKVVDDDLGAIDLSPNSVTGSELAGDSVGSDEIATNAVTSSEIAANAVDSSEIAADAVGSSELAANSVGQSEIGSGAVHSDEWNGANFILGPAVNAPNNALTNSTLNCPAGRKLISGGALTSVTGDLFDMVNNHPNTANQWRVGYRNDTGSSQTFNVIVFCANV